MIRATCAIAMLALSPGVVHAQEGALAIDQIAGASDASSHQVHQITTGERAPVSQAPRQPRDPSPPRQLTAASESQEQAAQLTSEGRGVRAPVQLYRGGRTAQASEPLSRPSEGRTGAVTAIVGKDRCDAADDITDETQGVCARVIETRAAEFERPDPATLSPEQRLLVERRLGEAPASARTAARRLAGSGMDPESLDEQVIASLALRPAAPPARDAVPEEESLSPEEAAIVNAIVNGSTGGTGPN